MDLDGFKDVNDTLGHNAGDDLLRHLSLRLSDDLPRSVGLYRLGGDEFAILCDVSDPKELLRLGRAHPGRRQRADPAARHQPQPRRVDRHRGARRRRT